MILIVGLGNPGEKFENTPHNAGFMAVDFFAKKNDFPEFSEDKKMLAVFSKKGKIILAKPTTFMNESGKAVKKIVSSFSPPAGGQASSFVVVHDDIDLALGKIKIVKNRGSAGHKGVESIIKNVGNKNLARVRIGTAVNKADAKKMVLKKFTPKQQELLGKTIKTVAQAIDCFINEGLEKTMNEFNR